MTDVTRRQFLAAAAGAAAMSSGLLAACSSSSSAKKGNKQGKLPGVGGITDPKKAPFDTVVVLMMENRSYDHLLGWMPGTNGKQAGLKFPDLHGAMVPTEALGSNTQACGDKDPAHDWQSVAKQFNDGKLDGWLQTQTTGDHFPIGYYEQPQVPILGALAQNYTLFDNYFCSLMAATWPNRFYQLCAATDVDETGSSPGPTDPRPSKLELAIFDRVQEAGLSTGYYTWGEPMTELFASKRYDAITHPKDQFFADAAAGKLPNVTFVDPDYTTVSEFLGTSNDYHPHGDIEAGEGYVRDVHDALKASPQWDRMVFVLNFDEHGGFYDHVTPPKVTDNNVNPNPGPHPDYGRLGFRVPAIAMGPFAPKKIEQAGPYEHCSVLCMIEWRWGLKPMTARDAHAKNLAEALDFTKKRPAIDLPPFNAPNPTVACPNPTVALA
ncbi:MAG: alkaline phosphatase family protein [Acidimicrobiales bacterium]